MRYTGNHGRKAFGVRRTSKKRLAEDIAFSIRKALQHGIYRTPADYTRDEATQALAQALLEEQ